MQLEVLQQHLERIYHVQLDHQVGDFLISDPELARQLDTSDNPRDSEEKLLVRQDDEDNLDLALYLAPELLERLADDNPHDALHDGNLADFCTVLEGVSHFVYLCWNASQGRPVSCLELEMQAEVDKYVSIVSVLSEQDQQASPQLHPWLFTAAGFDAALSPEELTRYRDANHYAGKYCHSLQRLFLDRPTVTANHMLDELRRFYRLPLHGKIRRIERMN